MPETIESGAGGEERVRELLESLEARRGWFSLSHDDACELVMLCCEGAGPENQSDEFARYIVARILVNAKNREAFERVTHSGLAYAFQTDFYACLGGWVDYEVQMACSYRYREFVAAYIRRISKAILAMWPVS